MSKLILSYSIIILLCNCGQKTKNPNSESGATEKYEIHYENEKHLKNIKSTAAPSIPI